MFFKKYTALFLLMLLSTVGFAQTDLTLYNMTWTPQAMYQNPALTPSSRINIGLPFISSIYGQASNTGFAWKDLLSLDPSGDSLTLTPENMLDKLADVNYLTGSFSTDYLSFGFKTGKAYIAFNATERGMVRFTYPKDLLGLAWYGNGDSQYLGQRANWDGLGVDAQSWRELGLSYTRDLDDGKLKIGGRLKYLNGTWAARTSKTAIGLSTDNTFYSLTADADGTLNLSGFNNQMAGLDTTSDAATINPTDYIFGKNHGLGIDLGLDWEVIDSTLRISASVVDLGFIRWANDPINITANEASFNFNGIDINDFPDSLATLNGEYFDSLGNAILDSVVNTFTPDSTYETFNAPTIARFYIGGNYLINDKMDAGLLFSGEIYKGRFRPSLTASYNLKVGRVLQLSASWSYTQRSWLNPGFGFSINAGPVQLYAVTDNLAAAFLPEAVRQVHFHTGINLTIGREASDRDEDGIPDKEDKCPDTPGLAEFDGCPDTDGDKIPDIRDKCPEVPGMAFDGCPDTDGDGIQDSEDDCVEEPGKVEFNGCPDRDNDGIMDKEDSCPDEPGLVETNGCPDRDRDGVIDMEDLCPDKAGEAEHKGCPDTDGDGLYDNKDRCIDEFGPTDNFGCPYGDLDSDGVFDKEDRCVDTPGPKENQGCPYGDLDGDSVTDNVDKCPNTPGPVENDGCPELNEEEEEILNTAFENLEFESAKSIIRKSSYESLDSLASLLSRNPDWKLKISGHTDSDGSEANNMNLSKNRANAVKDFLNNRGIDSERFVVEWFGESKPLVPNTSSANKQKNRRVEMDVIFD